MKKKTVYIFIFLIGLLCGYIPKFFHDLANFFSPIEYYYSESEALKRIEEEGVTLPNGATNINYYYHATIDHSCWLSFNIPKEELFSYLKRIESFTERSDNTSSFRVTHPNRFSKNKHKLEWWPSDLSEYIEYNAGYRIYYINEKACKIAIYSFST